MVTILTRSKTCLIVQWSRPLCRYLLVSRNGPQLRIDAWGAFETRTDESLIHQLKAELESRSLRVRQAIVMLPRTDLDITPIHLPPATDSELPELVEHAVAQETDEGGEPRVTDFIVTQQSDEACEAMSFSCPKTLLQMLKAEFKSAKMSLLAVTFTGFGAAELLKQASARPASTAIAVTFGDADVELTVAASGQPVLFRTLPISADEELPADRVASEIRRTLTLLHRMDDESARVHLMMSGRGDHQPLADELAERLSLAVSVIDPLDSDSILRAPLDRPAKYANLIGIARAWHAGRLELNLVSPRRPAKTAKPWQRIAIWGCVAASLLLSVGYMTWQDRQRHAEQVASQKNRLQELTDRANRARGLQDAADAIHRWKSDDVTWLDKLKELSDRLPNNDRALIRSMSMSTDTNQNGVIELSVQVSDPDVVSLLEEAVRDEQHSVTSRSVMATPDQSELGWKFDTRIVFQPSPARLPTPSEATKGGTETNSSQVPSDGAKKSEQRGITPQETISTPRDEEAKQP